MQVVLRFFSDERWSYYALVLVIIPAALLVLFTRGISIQDMVFLSLLGMMKGTLLPKILLTGFLCLLVFTPTTGWVKRSMIYVVSIVLMNQIKMNNMVHRMIMSSEILQFVLAVVIAVWMGYISYSIIWGTYIALTWKDDWIESKENLILF